MIRCSCELNLFTLVMIRCSGRPNLFTLEYDP
jgi:hypothetical protein